MSVRLSIGDVVLLYTSEFGGKQGIGLIKYIGSIRSPSCDILKEYVGIELIEPIESGHSGSIDGYQYFQCKESYGIHILITNVIKKLIASEIMIKLQEVISMFKSKLSQYINAINQRDTVINDLDERNKNLKSLLAATNFASNHSESHITSTPAGLTPIVDASSHHDLSLNQMINRVDIISSNSPFLPMAMQLNPSPMNMNGVGTPIPAMTAVTARSEYSPRTATGIHIYIFYIFDQL